MERRKEGKKERRKEGKKKKEALKLKKTSNFKKIEEIIKIT